MLYQPGLLVGELSGKAGHTYASKGPYGTWITVLGRHTAPKTIHALSARASFYAVQKLFGTLSPEQLDGWSALGLEVLISGRLGRNYTLTAASVFCQINRNLYTIGQDYVTDAPALTFPANVTAFVADATAPPTGSYEMNVDITPDVVPASTYFVIYGQKPRNTVANSYTKRGWKVLAVVPPAESNVLDIQAEYNARFHGWFPDQTIALSVIPVSAEGFQGNRLVTWLTSS